MNELAKSKLTLENKTLQDIARLNDVMQQAGRAAAGRTFADHTARKTDNTIRRKLANLRYLKPT